VNFLHALRQEAFLARTTWLLVAVLLALGTSRMSNDGRPRLRPIVGLLFIHLLLLVGTASLVVSGSEYADEVRIPAWVFSAVAFIGAASALLFHVVLPRLRLAVPRIVEDVLVALFSIATAVTVLSRAGINLSGLIATSAVVTAILGFSLQDIIGNIAGGLALQIDSSIEVGDAVKVNEVSGRVTEIRWRYTAIETGNGETVLVPNTVIVKSLVTILWRRQDKPKYTRRIIPFSVDFRFQPSDVIEVVSHAVHGAGIPDIADEPTPSCVLVDFGDSSGRYALRYWLKTFGNETITDSEVRTRIYFALERAGMRLALPAQALFVTDERDRAVQKKQKNLTRRTELLSSISLFTALSPDERAELAAELEYAPFARGETITRQGAEANFLYLVEEGVASVCIAEHGEEREVTKLRTGDFFGEMSLLTGAPRVATITAETDVECFRIGKEPFQRLLLRRPELAKELASVLIQRKKELDAARAAIPPESLPPVTVKEEHDLLDRIRDFFHLGD